MQTPVPPWYFQSLIVRCCCCQQLCIFRKWHGQLVLRNNNVLIHLMGFIGMFQLRGGVGGFKWMRQEKVVYLTLSAVIPAFTAKQLVEYLTACLPIRLAAHPVLKTVRFTCNSKVKHLYSLHSVFRFNSFTFRKKSEVLVWSLWVLSDNTKLFSNKKLPD